MAQVNVRNGGAIVDTTNFNVTISATLQHSSIGGDNAIDGGLTKRGTGTLTLSGLGSSYTGPTLVTGGMLDLAAGSVANLNNLTLNNAGLGLGLAAARRPFRHECGSGRQFGVEPQLRRCFRHPGRRPQCQRQPDRLRHHDDQRVTATVGPRASSRWWTYTGTPLANLNNFALGALPYGVTASLSNNTANHSIDLVVTAVSALRLGFRLPPPMASARLVCRRGKLAGFQPAHAGNGYFTRDILYSGLPADANAYTFGGAA